MQDQKQIAIQNSLDERAEAAKDIFQGSVNSALRRIAVASIELKNAKAALRALEYEEPEPLDI